MNGDGQSVKNNKKLLKLTLFRAIFHVYLLKITKQPEKMLKITKRLLKAGLLC